MFEIISIITIDEKKLGNFIRSEFKISPKALGYSVYYGQSDLATLREIKYDEFVEKADELFGELLDSRKEIRIFLPKTTFEEEPRDVTEEDIIKIMDWLEKDHSDIFEDIEYDESSHFIVFKAKHRYVVI
jgi:hypothetical protein